MDEKVELLFASLLGIVDISASDYDIIIDTLKDRLDFIEKGIFEDDSL